MAGLARTPSDRARRKQIVKITAAALVLALGGWLTGESADSIGPIAELVMMFVVPIVVAIAAFAIVRRRRIEIAVLLAVITFAAAYGGRECFAHAFNDCVRSAADIKGGLERYRATHGRYPASADASRCKRCLRGTILRYSSDGAHYVISFSDAVVSWETTDQTPWSVGK
jgi:hypothetical protein